MEENIENKTDNLLEGTIWERNNNNNIVLYYSTDYNIYFIEFSTKTTGNLIKDLKNRNIDIPFNYHYENFIIEIYTNDGKVNITMKSHLFNKNDNILSMDITYKTNDDREKTFTDISYKKVM